MLTIYILLLTLYQLACKKSYNDNEFEETIKKIAKNRYGGDASFLRKFVNDNGVPKGIGNRDGFDDSYCLDINEPVITNSKYADCTVMKSVNKSIVKLDSWSGFDIFKFSVNLLELKNVDLELVYQNELTYLYFSAFRKCENCLFNFTKNPSLVGLRFSYLSHEADLSKIEKKYRPKLFIRGNRRLKLSDGNDKRKRQDLRKICNDELCFIQQNEECHFRNFIKSQSEYTNCRYVYGDMHFSSLFQVNNPIGMNFKMDGCFIFNRTGIQYVRPIMKAYANCSHQHIFEYNKYMCTDQLDELIERWGPEKFKIISDNTKVKCYQGECRGGFVSEKVKHRYTNCEIFRGDVYVNEKSGNVSERIRDLSYAHLINGSLHIVNNTSVTKLTLPFLKKIDSASCPALLIENVTSLTQIIFHSHIEFRCNSTGPRVIIKNSPNLSLHHQILRQMRRAGAVLEDFNTRTDSYSEKVTLYLICICFLIVIFVEIIWALRRNLLLPNIFYRLFPMSIHRKPKQKQVKKKKLL